MLNETATVLVLSLTNKSCTERFGRVQCYLTKHGQNFAYFLLALALLPQIIHLFKSTHRYIAGVSYIWIIIRIFALISLILAHSFHWRSILEFIGLLMTMFIFAEIIIFSNNLHRQNKIILIVISGLLWIIGKFLVYFLVKDRRVLINLVYILFAIQMLPQILLNALLRTAKAVSKITIFLLLLSDFFLFISLPENRSSIIPHISLYFSFSFLLYICYQHLIHHDAHIHLISRSAHTVLTPGVDMFTGLDVDGKRSSGDDPQMFSIEDGEPMDEEDVVYQAVTIRNPPKPRTTQTCLLYALAGMIFGLECLITMILIYRIASPWIIFAPLSIVLVLVIFYFIRTCLNPQQTEILRKIL